MFNAMMIAIASISLLVGGIGIMNIMLASVTERTREIGTVRAIGMSRGAVMGMFMAEAIMLALVATSIGALAGAGIALGIDAMKIHVPVEAVQMVLMSDTVNLVVKPQQLIAAVLGFSIVTAISALYPAIIAARLQPVTAMQSVT
jgi:putative ABC transport system permease protein